MCAGTFFNVPGVVDRKARAMTHDRRDRQAR
jgi:hypothetical protein